jgi:DNA-binding transcriptional LysR family regulator
MDLPQLRSFVAVAELGSLTRAAERLHLSQPAISLQLKSLQETLGVELFRRTPRGMQLLPAGEQLLPYAERVLAAANLLKATAAGLSRTVTGKLRIGTILDPESLRLGLFLRTLVERFPGIETELSHGVSGWVLRHVKSEVLDVGFYLGTPEDERFHAVSLAPFKYQVVAPRGWKSLVAGRGWEELAALPWIWTPPDSAHNRMLTQLFAAQGVTPRIVALVDQEPSMLDLVKSGVGLSLARDSNALREAHAHGIVIADAVSLSTELTFVCLKRRKEEPPIAAALELIAASWAS